ncbi:MAG: radical SAM family heme chaperone HemW [Alphaproteobacteria bacterium]|nr:radical SAM family heme chaperone HemW [Alphaproteobacteria bacterium]
MTEHTITRPHNLYIHVPFCASKCAYCAFHSVVCKPDWNAYSAQIISDIKYWSGRLGRCAVPTIFFGGGTPSLMPTDVFARIMDAARETFDILPDAEITIESNPGTLCAARLREFMDAGVNRLSVGVQSFDDNELKFLGRTHSANDAIKLIKIAQDFGLNTSGDFIYGLPGQSVASVEKTCRGILDLGLRHVSLYELLIEPGTPLAMRGVQKIDDDTAAAMYEKIDEILAPALPRYEVSNYARAGFECHHNQNIWAGEPYIGIGESAAGRVLIDSQWFETKIINNKLNIKPLSNHDRAVEKIITGLRTMCGVELTPDVRAAINWDFVHANPNKFIVDDTHIHIGRSSVLFLDRLLIDLVA